MDNEESIEVNLQHLVGSLALSGCVLTKDTIDRLRNNFSSELEAKEESEGIIKVITTKNSTNHNPTIMKWFNRCDHPS